MTEPTPEEIAAQREADHLSATKIDANDELIRHINGLTTNTLRMWPEGEVQSWTIQRTEALAVLDAGEAATLDMAPFLTKVCVAQFGEATDAERLTQLQGKAAVVMGYADAWADLAAYLNGLRARTQDAIGEASDAVEVTAIVNAAKAEAAAVLSAQ